MPFQIAYMLASAKDLMGCAERNGTSEAHTQERLVISVPVSTFSGLETSDSITSCKTGVTEKSETPRP